MRTALAVLIGLGITMALITMLETIGYNIWPTMQGVDLNNTDAVRNALATAPRSALAWVVLSYGVAGFAAAFMARKIAGGDTTPSWIVGILLVALCAWNNHVIPQPRWMSIASLLIPLPAAWLGMRLAAIKRA